MVGVKNSSFSNLKDYSPDSFKTIDNCVLFYPKCSVRRV